MACQEDGGSHLMSAVCPPPIRSRGYVSGPDIVFINLTGGNPNAIGDVLVYLPMPCNSFFVSSVQAGREASSLMFHLTTIGRNYTTPAIAALGTEPWISLTTLPAAGPIYRTVIRFKEPILQFYVDIGAEGGVNTKFTLACVRDDNLLITGGLY